MKFFQRFLFSPIVLISIMLLTYNLHGQPSQIDVIIKKTYNQDFAEIPGLIENLKRTSDKVSEYLEIDYLWWRMISDFSQSTEKLFQIALDKIRNETNDEGDNYSKLFYFIYQIRYEHLKQHEFSKYISVLKLHFYLERIKAEDIKYSNALVRSLLELIEQSGIIMKYSLLLDAGINSAYNKSKLQSSLTRIENMKNSEYLSFDIIKLYYLGKLYFNIDKNYTKAKEKFIELSIICPDNKIFRDLIEECNKKCVE